MLWIRFDEHDRRTSGPHFCLNSIQGQMVCLQDLYEENNLVRELDSSEVQNEILKWLQYINIQCPE